MAWHDDLIDCLCLWHVRQTSAEKEEEGSCGLFGGVGRKVVRLYVLHSVVRF